MALKTGRFIFSNFNNNILKRKIYASAVKICQQKKYFIEKGKYCYHFDNFYLAYKNYDNPLYIVANEAYANNNFENFQFFRTELLIKKSAYLLQTSELELNVNASEIKNIHKDNFTKISNEKNNFYLEGSNLFLNYKKENLTLNKATLTMKNENSDL